MNGTVRRGALIVFEGCDRVGKTTQCKKLVEAIRAEGRAVEYYVFPDRTTASGRLIGDYLKGKSQLEDHAIHLLFSANRWERVPDLLKLLNSGTDVIVDRYAFSGVAFSTAKGLSLEWCKQADVGLPKPDLVVFLQLPSSVAEQRGGFGNEVYERREMQSKALRNYLLMKECDWQVIDADMDEEALHKTIKGRVDDVLATLPQDIRLLWIEK